MIESGATFDLGSIDGSYGVEVVVLVTAALQARLRDQYKARASAHATASSSCTRSGPWKRRVETRPIRWPRRKRRGAPCSKPRHAHGPTTRKRSSGPPLHTCPGRRPVPTGPPRLRGRLRTYTLHMATFPNPTFGYNDFANEVHPLVFSHDPVT
mmetsp:Transcript_1822/g.7050  ORF Transcript_1822/g.7050 Transcript_1822/m.7050 type:complete len:154 (+) Transcript_1822:688-1149(+)